MPTEIELIDEFLATSGYSQSTIINYRKSLNFLLRENSNLKKLTPAIIKKWMDGHEWGSSMQWVTLGAIRSYFRWRFGEKHPVLKLKIKRLDPPPQRVLNLKQAIALLESFDTSKPKGRRDLAICTLALDTGLRAAELCTLEVKYLDVQERNLMVRIKGGKFAQAVFSEYTANCLLSWLGDRKEITTNSPNLFLALGGKRGGESITTGGLRVEMRGWAKRAGLKHLSPHDLRRSFAVLSTRRGAPSRVLQVAGRWANIDMVERYTKAIEPQDFDPYFPVVAAMEHS